MFDKVDVENLLISHGTFRKNSHFVYAKKPDGWYHGHDYINKDAVYLHTMALRNISRLIAYNFYNKHACPEVVVGPTIGGAILSQWTAHQFNKSFFEREVLSVYAEEAGSKRVLKRGYDKAVKGKDCLIVEDVINSGNTAIKTVSAITEAGGKVIGVGAICNRSGGKVTAQTLGVPHLYSLLDLDMKMQKEEDCLKSGPCSKGEPINQELGHGRQFLKENEAKFFTCKICGGLGIYLNESKDKRQCLKCKTFIDASNDAFEL